MHRLLKYRVLAQHLGVTERHIKRLMLLPEFRKAVGAYRRGNQWRIDEPEWMPSGMAVIAERARKAVPSLGRWKPGNTTALAIHKAYGGRERALEVEALRLALREINAGNDDEESKDLRQTEICLTAQLISTEYNKAITQVPAYWSKYLRSMNRERKKRNADRAVFSRLHGAGLPWLPSEEILQKPDLVKAAEGVADAHANIRRLKEAGRLKAQTMLADSAIPIWPPTERIEYHLQNLKDAWWINQIVDIIEQLEREGITPIGKEISKRVYSSYGAMTRGRQGVSHAYYRRIKGRLKKKAESLTTTSLERIKGPGSQMDDDTETGIDYGDGLSTASADDLRSRRFLEEDPDYELVLRNMNDPEEARKIREVLACPF
jgi:hypothetical protein